MNEFDYNRGSLENLLILSRYKYVFNVSKFGCFRRGGTVSDANRALLEFFKWLYTMQRVRDWELSEDEIKMAYSDGYIKVPVYLFLNSEEAVLYARLKFK